MDLIRLANKNAVEEVERATTREERQSKTLEALGKMLDMETPPNRIESYDISNQGADDIVASMVVYVGGKPLKRDYRHFKLKDMDSPNDYASMEQVLTRRFQRYLDGDEKFSDLPDALFIDGGQEHARVAVGVEEKLGLHIPVYGMVKDDRHRTRALMTPDGREIGIQRVPAVFALVGQIQEETHTPPAAVPAGKRLGTGQDPRHRSHQKSPAAEAFQERQEHQSILFGRAPTGGGQGHGKGGLRLVQCAPGIEARHTGPAAPPCRKKNGRHIWQNLFQNEGKECKIELKRRKKT